MSRDVDLNDGKGSILRGNWSKVTTPIPGNTGLPSATNPMGEQWVLDLTSGVAGPQGPAGPAGATGPQGPTGATGSAGAQGAQGAQGPQGQQGVQGNSGADGAAGASGAQGPKGDKGDTGNAGANGTDATAPAGVVLPFAGTAAPTGYLLCDGASLVRADYAALFTAIGTTYGAADGTHFNVPDARGRHVLGKAASGTGSVLGSTGGALDHAHDAHAVTQPADHSNHPQHSTQSPNIAWPGAAPTQAAHTHDAHTTTASKFGTAVGAPVTGPSTHSSLAPAISWPAGVPTIAAHQHDLHSNHSAHSGAAVAAHAAANAPFLSLNYIIKT